MDTTMRLPGVGLLLLAMVPLGLQDGASGGASSGEAANPRISAVAQARSADLRLTVVMGNDGDLGDRFAVAVTNMSEAAVLLPDLDAIHLGLSLAIQSLQGDSSELQFATPCCALRRAGLNAVELPAKSTLIVELGSPSQKWREEHKGHRLVPRLHLAAGTAMEYILPSEAAGAPVSELVPRGMLKVEVLVLGEASNGIAAQPPESPGDRAFRQVWLDGGVAAEIQAELRASESARNAKVLEYWIRQRRLPSDTTRENLVPLSAIVGRVEEVLAELGDHALGAYGARELLQIAFHPALDGAGDLRLRFLERLRRLDLDQVTVFRIDALRGWASAGKLDLACQLMRY